MAELATIARPYAEALFKASSSNLGATSAWLDKLAVISTDPALLQFASGPRTTTEQMLGIVTSANGAPLTAPAQNFLGALLDNGRFAVLPEIAKQFRALANARSGSSDAIVYSAFPIDDAALVGVSAALEKRFGRKLQVTVQQEPALIGGIRVVVGDEVLDTSVKARLEQMKVALAA